jgi:hypothetical protein
MLELFVGVFKLAEFINSLSGSLVKIGLAVIGVDPDKG